MRSKDNREQHVRDGVITIRTEKHRKDKPGELVTIPILEPLAASIAATATGDLTYLVTQAGRPWVKESFGTWFRAACRKARCPGSAHGLRKAGATRAAERGASERQLMAISGWSTGKMAQHYTRSTSSRSCGFRDPKNTPSDSWPFRLASPRSKPRSIVLRAPASLEGPFFLQKLRTLYTPIICRFQAQRRRAWA
jgi:hypothetical protein